jgi:hypothetical protein
VHPILTEVGDSFSIRQQLECRLLNPNGAMWDVPDQLGLRIAFTPAMGHTDGKGRKEDGTLTSLRGTWSNLW